MTTHYTPIPHNEENDELDAAFASDDDDDEQQELIHSPLPSAAVTTPGTYDFERDYPYDYPPPGSPPHPSERALPNDYGNTNGRIPTSPIRRSPPRPSFIRRAVGALLPQHYSRVPTSESHHPVGGGIDNDGVFANVMAKPQPQRTITTENGDVYLAPEETVRENLPSYDDARADAVPPYWETVVHAPSDPSSILIDDLPAGSIFILVLNLIVSYLFQFVGFFLTYLLHTSHAAKYGSRIGLGLTLIQFALYSRSAALDDNTELGKNKLPPVYNGTDPTSKAPVPDDGITFSSKDWLPIIFMTIGWLLLLYSIVGYWRVKRWESSLRSSQTQTQEATPEQIERDRAVRRQINAAFGVPVTGDDPTSRMRFDEYGNMLVLPSRNTLAEDRLARDLRAAGLM